MKRDLMRVAGLLLLGLVLVVVAPIMGKFVDAGLSGAAYSLGLVALIAGFSHVTRRVLMPRLDFQQFAARALETPMSAAVAFIGLCYLLSTLISVGVALMRMG